MTDQTATIDSYAIQYSDIGKESRQELPYEILPILFEVLDTLSSNPNGYPNRTRVISRDGNIRLYSHPSPALQITFELDASRKVLYLLHFVAPKVQATKPVFISYSHKDTQWLEKLRQFLQPLEDDQLIRVWDDTEIQPGADWLNEIRTALKSARVAVFLVTQNFMTSDFIRNKELPILLEAAQGRGCLIFWIAVSSTTFEESPLARIQGANSPHKPLDLMTEGEQNSVLVEITKKMRSAVKVN